MASEVGHLDWGLEAEWSERAELWPKAAEAWRKAAAACDEPGRRAEYETNAARCEAEIALDEWLASIARDVLHVPTLEPRGLDRLDFHDIGVWQIRAALRAAYKEGQSAQPQPA
ncbi:MAG: hypothetical protein WD069_18595 [Planctomycetales bacterium]